jgi:hypothetical protein
MRPFEDEFEREVLLPMALITLMVIVTCSSSALIIQAAGASSRQALYQQMHGVHLTFWQAAFAPAPTVAKSTNDLNLKINSGE